MIFSKEEANIISTIIVALETGGQVYGKGDWGNFGEAYNLSLAEHAITIGVGWYGPNALKLLKKIYNADSKKFISLDTAGVRNDFDKDWNNYRISKSSDKAKCIIKIISSEIGIQCQKEMLGEYMQDYAEKAQKLGVTDHKALAECCNFHYQGGYGAMKRVIQKTKKPYTLDNLYAAVLTDNEPNQIGTYTYRQKACYNMINTYWVKESTTKSSTSYNKWTGYICKSATPRTGPGSTYKILSGYPSLKVGTKVEIFNSKKDNKKSEWYYVKINGKEVYGYIWHGNISKTDPTKKVNETASSTIKTKSVYGKVIADVLNVRSGAGLSNSLLKSIPTIKYGTTVQIINTARSKDGSDWYYICINGNTYGYVYADYIKKI